MPSPKLPKTQIPFINGWGGGGGGREEGVPSLYETSGGNLG